MRATRFSLLLCSCLLSPVFAVGQEPPPRDPQAVIVLQQSLLAMGGQYLMQAQDSVVSASTVILLGENSESGTVVIKTRGQNQIRWDGSAGGQSSSTIINAGHVVQETTTGQQPRPSANARNARPDHLPALLLAYELNRGDLSIRYLGTTTVQDQPAHHVQVKRVSDVKEELGEKLTENSALDIFIDSRTFRVVKVSYLLLSDTDWRRGRPLEVYYSDYRDVGGVAIPFQQKRVFSGTPVAELHLTSVQFNVGLSDSEFVGR